MVKQLTFTNEIHIDDKDSLKCSKHCQYLDRSNKYCAACMEYVKDWYRCKHCLEKAR